MPSLDPYPLQAHTLLDAVNMCLRAIGSGMVLALDSASLSVDSETALKSIHDTSMQVQQDGWQWNTEQALVLDPWPADGSAAAGTVSLPTNTLKLLSINPTNGRNYVQRGNRVYDSYASTYNIGKAITCKLVVALDFEELPQAARHYIAVRAAREFAQGRLNNTITNQFTAQDEEIAWIALLEAEDLDDDSTLLDQNTYLAARARHRRRTD